MKRRLVGYFRIAFQELFRMAGKDGEAQPEIAFRIGMTKSSQQPFAEEAGTAGDEDAFTAQFLEFAFRVTQDVGQVASGKGEEIFL